MPHAITSTPTLPHKLENAWFVLLFTMSILRNQENLLTKNEIYNLFQAFVICCTDKHFLFFRSRMTMIKTTGFLAKVVIIGSVVEEVNQKTRLLPSSVFYLFFTAVCG